MAVTVEAAAGVFPAGAMLEVRRVRAGMALQAAEAVDEVRDEDVNVAASYTFDIRVIDPATGEELQPAEGQSVSVSFALAEVADENLTTSVTRAAGEDAGVYTVTPAGEAVQGNYAVRYAGALLTIAPKPLDDGKHGNITIEIDETGIAYDGEGKTPGIVVKDGDTVVPEDEYTVRYDENTGAGTATVVIEDVPGGNYEISGKATFVIEKADIAPAVSLDGWTYGDPAKPPVVTGNPENGAVTVEYKPKGADDSAYAAAIPAAAGRYVARVSVAATANHKGGTATAEFEIAPKAVSTAPGAGKSALTITVEANGAPYDGTAKAPAIVVKDGDTVIPASEYTVAFENNTNAGTATVKITDAPGGNYDVSGTAAFTIEKAKLTVTAQDAGKTEGEADPALTYTATGLIGGDSLTGALGREAGEAAGIYAITQGTLSAGDNYAIAFTGAAFTIAPKPDYTVLAKLAPVGKTALKLAWDRDEDADGYDVFYRQCDGKKNYPLYRFVVGNAKCSCKITGLKKGVTYKAYVLAWRMVDGEKSYIGLAAPTVHAIAGRYNGNWTNAKKVTPNRTALTMLGGSTGALSATVTGVKAGRKVLHHVNLIRWYSSDTSVATVDADGVVTAVGTGACTIWAVANNGERAGVKLTVVEKPTGVAFEKKSYGVRKGKALKLTQASVTEGLTWASSNPKVAKVDGNGVVRGVKKGKATITVTAADGSTAKVKIKVK